VRVFVRQEKCPDMGFIGHALLAFDLLITACPASRGGGGLGEFKFNMRKNNMR
jgi:hypothetical protein